MAKKAQKPQPRIFLSYAREDSALVGLISDFLAPLPIPVFLDTRSIVPGERWDERIVQEVEKATHVYVFWSKYAAASEWVKTELELALKGGKVVIPVIIDGTRLPQGLSRHMFVDARFVAGINQGDFDAGRSGGRVSSGEWLLGELGFDVDQLLAPPRPGKGWRRADRYVETDPRLVALGMYGALGATL